MEIIVSSLILTIGMIIMYAMRLHSKKPKPFVHEHIWEPWKASETTRIFNPKTDTQWDERIYYTRTCLDCGDVEHKQYSLWKKEWTYADKGNRNAR